MLQEQRGDLARTVVDFCRFARANGFSAGVKETLDSLEAVRTVPTTDRETFKFALRAGLCSSKEEWDLFDDLFEAFWSGFTLNPQPASEDSRHIQRPKADRHGEEGKSWVLSGRSGGSVPRGEDEGKAISGASIHERLKKMDFSRVPQSDQAALERIAQHLLRQMSLRLSRKLKIAESRDRVDLRRTIRRSIGRGGYPIDLSYKGRKPRQARLVILLDVSGSMNLYSLFLLRFAHALQKHFQRADTFIFSTSLVEVTGALRSQQLPEALKQLSQKPAGWSGGTKIGESLGDFNRLHSRRSLSRDTVFIILSDGLDTGEPEVLASELRTIQRRVKKLVWLNPLLGLDNYQPIARGMAAALPYVDVFAPAHCLEGLLELGRHLTRSTLR